jgi:hypothetical protein
MGHILKALHAKNGEDPLENKFLLSEWNILGLFERSRRKDSFFCIGPMVICAFGLLLNPAKVSNYQYKA